jgi:hypothetical protein
MIKNFEHGGLEAVLIGWVRRSDHPSGQAQTQTEQMAERARRFGSTFLSPRAVLSGTIH